MLRDVQRQGDEGKTSATSHTTSTPTSLILGIGPAVKRKGGAP